MSEDEVARDSSVRVPEQPTNHTWEHWFAYGTRVTEDFLIERDEPPMQQRPQPEGPGSS